MFTTVHRNVDVDLLLQTFPNSLLNLDLNLDEEKIKNGGKKKKLLLKHGLAQKNYRNKSSQLIIHQNLKGL